MIDMVGSEEPTYHESEREGREDGDTDVSEEVEKHWISMSRH
jgi:hypothetical protein